MHLHTQLHTIFLVYLEVVVVAGYTASEKQLPGRNTHLPEGGL
jgi:hypothetical protein